MQPEESNSKNVKWPRVKLGDICDLVNGDAYRETDWNTEGVPIIRIQNLNNPDKPFNYWTGSIDDRVVVKPGDVLLAWSGTPGTSFGTHRWTRGVGILNQHIFRVDLDTSRIDPEWAVFSINEQLEEMIGRAHGAVGLRHVTKGECESLPILLPPLAEQRRIAARLRKQMAGVEQARAAVQAQLDAAKKLPAALLRAVFERGKWKWLRVDDLAETCSGTTPSRGRQDFYGGKIPWVKTGELVDGVIHDTEEHITETALRETSLRLLPKNTLLIAMYGQGQTRGRTALLACEATTNQACFAILPNEKFDPKFLQLWFQFSYARLRQASEGRGGNQSNFNGKVLGAEQVPLPPVPEQRAIVARLDTELTAARSLVETLVARLAEIELLPATLLRSAFAGA
jgi:type I restriction enzyme S subunit